MFFGLLCNHEITNNVFGGLWLNHEITNNVLEDYGEIMK
jgi:hypothetical protein